VSIDRLNLAELAKRALATARRRNLAIVTAESCTAGKLSALLSEAPGAAEHLHGSFVAYTKANKVKVLGVDPALLKTKARFTVRPPMWPWPSRASQAPDPDEDANPVGLVCIAVARDGRAPLHIERNYGDIGREKVQEQAMADALAELIRWLDVD
jgi:nicotinamide-nucleotide amidase